MTADAGAPVVLITGAAGGIGSALAKRYALAGYRLALVDIDETGLAALGAALRANGHEVTALPCDVTDAAASRAAVVSVIREFGGIDVVIANAGRTHLSFVADTDPSVFHRVMAINFFGAVHIAHAALPSLIERRGRIAVVSSIAGFAPLSGRAGYAASKHALHGFFDSLRGELRQSGVTVTLVCPWFTRTAIGARALGADGGPATLERTEMGKALEPAHVASAIYEAVRRRRRLLVLSAPGKLAWLLSRVAPRLYDAIMVRRLARGERE